MDKLILVINPGSTSTKIGLFKEDGEVFRETIRHAEEDLAACGGLYDQRGYRLGLVTETLQKHGYTTKDLAAVVGRGGLLPPVKAGGYIVDKAMTDLIVGDRIQRHASNLGALLAEDVALSADIPAFIYDAVSVDEYDPIAKVTGLPETPHISFSHVLNSKAVSRHWAKENGKKYEDINVVVVHMGGGISVTAHKKGRIVDSTTDDYGPFSPERAGSLPMVEYTKLCFSGKYDFGQMRNKLQGEGGIKAHLDTSDMMEVERRVMEGEEHATFIWNAQIYQIAKGIGSLIAALGTQPDAIILTGGLANAKLMTDGIQKRAGFLGNIVVIPGEFELEALAEGGFRILNNEEAYHRLEVENS